MDSRYQWSKLLPGTITPMQMKIMSNIKSGKTSQSVSCTCKFWPMSADRAKRNEINGKES